MWGGNDFGSMGDREGEKVEKRVEKGEGRREKERGRREKGGRQGREKEKGEGRRRGGEETLISTTPGMIGKKPL